MNDETECFHNNLQYRYHLTAIVDHKESDAPASNILQVAAMCKDCKHEMKFIGLPESVSLKGQPFSPDGGTTVCLPMVVGTAIVTEDRDSGSEEGAPTLQ